MGKTICKKKQYVHIIIQDIERVFKLNSDKKQMTKKGQSLTESTLKINIQIKNQYLQGNSAPSITEEMHIKTMKVIQTAHSSNTKPLLGRESRTLTTVNAAVDMEQP